MSYQSIINAILGKRCDTQTGVSPNASLLTGVDGMAEIMDACANMNVVMMVVDESGESSQGRRGT